MTPPSFIPSSSSVDTAGLRACHSIFPSQLHWKASEGYTDEWIKSKAFPYFDIGKFGELPM